MLLENEKSARVNCSTGASSSSDSTEPGTQLTLGQAIGRIANRLPHQPAIVSPTFTPLTYRDLRRQLDEIRRQLRQAGFGCSARIGVLMPNGPEAILAIVAVACCSIAVPLDPRLTPAEIDQRLDMLRLNALLVPQGSASEARQTAERRRLTIIEAAPVGHGRIGLTIAVQVSDSPASDAEPDPGSPAFILQTSGTTGRPKLIPFSHANMLAAAARLQAWFELTPRDRCLSVSPPYYSHGLKVTVFTPLLTGGSIALPANVTAIDLPEWFDIVRPTWYSAGPTLHCAVLDKARTIADVSSMHTLRFIVSGGAPLSPVVREELQAILKVPVLEHYGSSEAAQIAANLPTPSLNRPGTCGRPWPGTVVVVDEGGRPLPHGMQGEVWVRGPTVMSGYLDDLELNQRAFVDGWLRTGDLGSLDKDGFLSLHGRLTELINRGGEKVAPVEIDSALLRHPAVAEAAAFPVPHPRYGEDVVAAVVLHPSASATPADLRRFLQNELTSFKIPRRIFIQDHLPKGITGKVQRLQLTDSFTASAGKAKNSSVPASNRHTQKIERKLLQIWRRLLKSENLTIDDDFFESGGDSLLALEMLLEVEKVIGHPLPASLIVQAETIRLFGPKIATQVGIPGSPSADFNADGDEPPLFFFYHAALNEGSLLIRKLVRCLAPDQPFVMIEPHGSHGEPVPPSIEQMALDRLQLILQRQPNGPYRIMGSCKGALIAFEVAHLLTRAGHRVEFVGLVDPPTTNAHSAMRLILSIIKHAVSPAGLTWAYDQMNRYERLMKMPWAQRLAKAQAMITKPRALLLPNTPPSTLTETYTPIMACYRAAPLAVPVAYFAAEFDGYRWRRLSPDLTVIELPGDHNSCVAAGAEILAGYLRNLFW